jgi:hypothetical protein
VRLHAPKGTTPQTGSDSNSGSIGITGVPGVAPKSITAAPGAGSAPTAASSTEAAATGSTPSSSSKIKFGPVQLLGILLVGGVGIAFVSVANTRARRQ